MGCVGHWRAGKGSRRPRKAGTPGSERPPERPVGNRARGAGLRALSRRKATRRAGRLGFRGLSAGVCASPPAWPGSSLPRRARGPGRSGPGGGRERVDHDPGGGKWGSNRRVADSSLPARLLVGAQPSPPRAKRPGPAGKTDVPRRAPAVQRARGPGGGGRGQVRGAGLAASARFDPVVGRAAG